jgi:hypothetical protein
MAKPNGKIFTGYGAAALEASSTMKIFRHYCCYYYSRPRRFPSPSQNSELLTQRSLNDTLHKPQFPRALTENLMEKEERKLGYNHARFALIIFHIPRQIMLIKL